MGTNRFMETGERLRTRFDLLIDRYGRLWYWQKETREWLCDHDMYWFSRQVQDYAQSQEWAGRWSPAFDTAVWKYLAPRLDRPWEEAPSDRVHLINGLLDLRGGQKVLVDASPNFKFVNKLPVIYDPRAQPTEWERFFAYSMTPEVLDVLWEVLAWLTFSLKDVNAIVCLHGEAGSGKSRVLNAIRAFIGEENLLVVSKNDLEGNRFMKQHISYKLCVMYDDLPAAQGSDNGVLKMIADRSAMMTDVKFGRPQWVVNYANCLFAANWVPRSVDTSDGFFDRWNLLPMKKRMRFTDQQVVATEIDRLLSQPEQLSGVLNRVLEARERIMGPVNKMHFSQPQALKDAQAQFRQEVDPILQWFYSRLEERQGAQLKVSDCHSDYLLWCERRRVQNKASVEIFGRVVLDHVKVRGLKMQKVRARDSRGLQVSHWRGVDWKVGTLPNQ